MATLPTYTATIDNAFTETFFEIRAQAADNILNSNVIWALLKMKGVMKTQVGGTNIERSITYATGPTPSAVAKGDLLPTGEGETDTAAYWRFGRYLATHIQRDAITDQQNAGKFKIVDYVTRRTERAMEALRQMYNGCLLRAHVAAETGKFPQGLADVVPPAATRATGNWGGIARPTTYSSDLPTVGNTWWSPRYYGFHDVTVDMVTDMDHMFNLVGNQQDNPDIILTSQRLFEIYHTYGLEAIQYVNNQKLLDLGFTSLKFKNADLTYCPEMAGSGTTIFDGTAAAYAGVTSAMLFLNSSNLEFIYDPNMWFMPLDWVRPHNQMTRIMHILCCGTMISDQPRRHGLLYV